jgi:hypothetical protein
MSTTQNTLRREMLLQQAIDKQQDELVGIAAKTVELLENNRAMETSQLRNLLNVSLETTSTEVVVSFICYQIGRKKEVWGTHAEDFGHTVIDNLHKKLTKQCKEVIDEVVKELAEKKQELSDEEKENLQIAAKQHLVQRYLGYVHRWFYFLDKSDKNQKATVIEFLENIGRGATQ